EEIEKAIKKVTGEKVILYGSGRTDAKVHALGHVANFHTRSPIPGEKFRHALNAEHPEDIKIIASQEVPKDFHSRFSATHKRNVYRIYKGESERTLLRHYTWHVKRPLDVECRKQVAVHFLGTHDFKSFRGRRTSNKSSVRTIYSIEILNDGEILELAIEGNCF